MQQLKTISPKKQGYHIYSWLSKDLLKVILREKPQLKVMLEKQEYLILFNQAKDATKIDKQNKKLC